MFLNRKGKITKIIIPYDFCEITRMEKWINGIADSGMEIYRMSQFRAKFRKQKEPGRYLIRPTSFCKEEGLKEICNYPFFNSDMKIFKAVDNETIKDYIIDSLPEIEERECKRTVRNNTICIPVFTAILVCVLIGLKFSSGDNNQMIFVKTILNMAAIIVALFIIVSDVFSILIARKHLKNKDYNIIKNGENRLSINKILYVVSIISSVMLALFFAVMLIGVVTSM